MAPFVISCAAPHGNLFALHDRDMFNEDITDGRSSFCIPIFIYNVENRYSASSKLFLVGPCIELRNSALYEVREL